MVQARFPRVAARVVVPFASAALVVVGSCLLSASPASAQAAAVQRWEYAVYSASGPNQSLLPGPGREVVQGRRFQEFLLAIGGTEADVPDRYAPTAAVDLAVITVLARRGWELVSCTSEGLPEDGRRTCYFRRALGESS